MEIIKKLVPVGFWRLREKLTFFMIFFIKKICRYDVRSILRKKYRKLMIVLLSFKTLLFCNAEEHEK